MQHLYNISNTLDASTMPENFHRRRKLLASNLYATEDLQIQI